MERRSAISPSTMTTSWRSLPSQRGDVTLCWWAGQSTFLYSYYANIDTDLCGGANFDSILKVCLATYWFGKINNWWRWIKLTPLKTTSVVWVRACVGVSSKSGMFSHKAEILKQLRVEWLPELERMSKVGIMLFVAGLVFAMWQVTHEQTSSECMNRAYLNHCSCYMLDYILNSLYASSHIIYIILA